jgi:hypothetical protein
MIRAFLLIPSLLLLLKMETSSGPMLIEALVEIQSQMHEVVIGGVNIPVWNSRSGRYSYFELNVGAVERNEIGCKLVETRLISNVYSSACLLWLVFWDALVTKQKMCCWGYVRKSLCLFCHRCQESRKHIFFRCEFSRGIWTCIMADWSFVEVPFDWESIESWGSSMLHEKSFKACLKRLCLGATVYHLWRQQNDLLHCNTPRMEEAILAQIKWEVRARVFAKGHFKCLGKSLPLV